ncbi:MAG: hypothetical protein SNJ73_05295, partial [Acetobacteraceae bacterium]
PWQSLERIGAPIPAAELHAAFAMAYFDKARPRFDLALQRIDAAIAKAQATPAKYQIIRGVSLVMLARQGGASVGEAVEALRGVTAKGGWIENPAYRDVVNAFAREHGLIEIPDTRPGA